MQQVSGPISGIRRFYVGRYTRDARAVRTAGVQVGGEGYLGFSQPLFLAGTWSLLVSLWPVCDNATALLMVRSYENWLGKRDGIKPMPKVRAIEEAKQWLRNLPAKDADAALSNLTCGGESAPIPMPPPTANQPRPFEHPYDWSGFILIGDPG